MVRVIHREGTDVEDWRKYIGSRLLVAYRNDVLERNIMEVEVLEVSPSGKYVKLKFIDSGVKKWVDSTELKVVEVLEW